MFRKHDASFSCMDSPENAALFRKIIVWALCNVASLKPSPVERRGCVKKGQLIHLVQWRASVFFGPCSVWKSVFSQCFLTPSVSLFRKTRVRTQESTNTHPLTLCLPACPPVLPFVMSPAIISLNQLFTSSLCPCKKKKVFVLYFFPHWHCSVSSVRIRRDGRGKEAPST